jgi:hypothetical protein
VPVAKAPYAPPSLPAVDGINYKGELFLGSLDTDSHYGAAGSVSIPLAQRYGLQLDGLLSSADGRFFGDIAAHLFWRDPAVGLVGAYASYTRWNQAGGLNQSHVGVEFERYFDRWQIEGLVGAESGNKKTPAPFLFFYDVKSRFFDYLDLAYYPQPDLRLSIGHRYLLGDHALALGAEWGRPLGGGRMGTFFVEGNIGENDFKSIWAGFRMYFGTRDKSLMARHREDDPRARKKRKPGRESCPEFGCDSD